MSYLLPLTKIAELCDAGKDVLTPCVVTTRVKTIKNLSHVMFTQDMYHR